MDIAWIKRTVNRKLAKCHGYYLQHAKETCLVGLKVNCQLKTTHNLPFTYNLLGRIRSRNICKDGW